MRFLLDSVILSDHFNGIRPATEFVADHAAELALSVITRAEVLTGFDKEAETLALGLLDGFVTLPLTRDIADLSARLHRARRWKLPDALQAAMALHHGLVLVTRNTRDFPEGGSGELEVMVPYRI